MSIILLYSNEQKPCFRKICELYLKIKAGSRHGVRTYLGICYSHMLRMYCIALKRCFALKRGVKHHICVELEESGINTVIAGHSATEQIYLPKLREKLSQQFPSLNFIVNYNNEKASVI